MFGKEWLWDLGPIWMGMMHLRRNIHKVIGLLAEN